MNEEKIESKFEKSFSKLAELNPVFPQQAKEQMAKMVNQIAKSNQIYTDISSTKQSVAVKAGFSAEEFHTETHNLDAILNDDSTRVYTDNYDEWYDNGFKKNDTPDIIAIKDGKVTHKSQVKYYKDSDSTSKAMREVKDGKPKYEDMDTLLGPSDQINPEDGAKSIKDQAHKTVLKESGSDGRESVKNAAKEVEEKATDTINTGESESTPLSKKEAEDLAKNPDKSKKTNIENEYQSKSTIQNMKKAAIGAASMSAIMSGTYNTVLYCKMVKDGKITEKEAFYKIVSETASSAADSAVKASAVTGTQSLMIRYGSKKLVEKMTEQSLKGMIKSNLVTVGVVCAIDTIKDLIKLSSGKITEKQFYERQGKNIINTGAGSTGGIIGYSVGTAVATSLSVSSTASTIIGVVGGISGGLIAGLAMQLAIENHVEQTYSDIMRNTANIQESLKILQDVSISIFKGQQLFSEFLNEEYRLNNIFNHQIENINKANYNMKSAIDDL